MAATRPVPEPRGVDTQWWVRSWKKRSGPEGNPERDRAVADLRAALAEYSSRPTLVVAHHPFASHGEHSGFLDWRGWIFPLKAYDLPAVVQYAVPVPGGEYLVRHLIPIKGEDMWDPSYRRTRMWLEPIVRASRPLLYATGHDHSLQVLAKDGYLQLISGAGTTGTRGRAVTAGDDTLFASTPSVFMRLDVALGNRARLGVWIVEGPNDHATEAYSMFLPLQAKTGDARRWSSGR